MLSQTERLLETILSPGEWFQIPHCILKASSPSEAVLFMYLVGKSRRYLASERDGWFFCTTEEVDKDLGIPARVQHRIIQKLKDKDWLESAAKGVPAKRHFKLALTKAVKDSTGLGVIPAELDRTKMSELDRTKTSEHIEERVSKKEPIGNNTVRQKKPKTAPPYSEPFKAFWNVYPRRVGRRAAFKAYEKAVAQVQVDDNISQEEAQEKLLVAAEAFRSEGMEKGEFCPYPSTWLNQGHYDNQTQSDGEDDGPAAALPEECYAGYQIRKQREQDRQRKEKTQAEQTAENYDNRTQSDGENHGPHAPLPLEAYADYKLRNA